MTEGGISMTGYKRRIKCMLPVWILVGCILTGILWPGTAVPEPGEPQIAVERVYRWYVVEDDCWDTMKAELNERKEDAIADEKKEENTGDIAVYPLDDIGGGAAGKTGSAAVPGTAVPAVRSYAGGAKGL